MTVKMQVKFKDEDILEMCRKRLESIECPCEGYFDVEHGPSYEHSVVATFVPGRKPAEEPLEPLPTSAQLVPIAPPDMEDFPI